MNAHMGYISNILVINVLHASNIGVGFIPILAAALYLFCILSTVGRTGISPAPTADKWCKYLSISGLKRILGRIWTIRNQRACSKGRQTESLLFFRTPTFYLSLVRRQPLTLPPRAQKKDVCNTSKSSLLSKKNPASGTGPLPHPTNGIIIQFYEELLTIAA